MGEKLLTRAASGSYCRTECIDQGPYCNERCDEKRHTIPSSDAAKFLRMDEATLRSKVDQGIITAACRYGDEMRFTATEVVRYIVANRKTGLIE